MEKNIKKVKANIAFVKKVAKATINEIKSSPNYKDVSLEDIESMDMSFGGSELSKEVSDAIRITVVASLYLDKCNVKHITERLRHGYVGMETVEKGSIKMQTVRGEPYGTLVSLPSDDGRTVIGISYVKKNDRFSIPIVGEYIALKRAIENQKLHSDGLAKAEHIRGCALAQVEHFYKRSLAYWNPEKYSYSRGSEPVVYDNFEKIHENQLRILGKEKVKTFATRISRKSIKELNLVGTISDTSDLMSLLAHEPKQGDYFKYSGERSITIEASNDFKTKTKGPITLEKGDWLVYNNNLWEVLYNSEEHIAQAVSKIQQS